MYIMSNVYYLSFILFLISLTEIYKIPYPYLAQITGFSLLTNLYYWYMAKFSGSFAGAILRTAADTAIRIKKPTEERLEPVKGVVMKWYQAVIPVAVLIIMTIYGLIDTGLSNIYLEMKALNIPVASSEWSDVLVQIAALPGQDGAFFTTIGKIIGQADSYIAMLWASMSSLIVAVVMTVIPKIMSAKETVNTIINGFKIILPGLLILVFAWALAQTIGELHTATYLSSLMENALNPKLMPVLTFILAATIAFSTGSSWGVMAILYPIVIPTTWVICQAAGMDPDASQQLLTHVISVVLAAAVFGDHCSPISDTTILSSIACGCNHIDHVRTQLPYALTVGGVSLLLCVLSSLFDGGWLLNFFLLLLGAGILYSIILGFGKQVPNSVSSPPVKN